MKFRLTARMFEIKGYNAGSRLRGMENLMTYEIWFTSPDGKHMRMSKTFHTRTDARKYIATTCKLANDLMKQAELRKQGY